MVDESSLRSKLKLFEEKGEIYLDGISPLDDDADLIFDDEIEVFPDAEYGLEDSLELLKGFGQDS